MARSMIKGGVAETASSVATCIVTICLRDNEGRPCRKCHSMPLHTQPSELDLSVIG